MEADIQKACSRLLGRITTNPQSVAWVFEVVENLNSGRGVYEIPLFAPSSEMQYYREFIRQMNRLCLLIVTRKLDTLIRKMN